MQQPSWGAFSQLYLALHASLVQGTSSLQSTSAVQQPLAVLGKKAQLPSLQVSMLQAMPS